MVVINIGIGTDKKAVSRLEVTLDDGCAEEINAEEVVYNLHSLVWKYLRSWDDTGVAITIKTEAVE